jgi:alpha-1,3-rhamnosyl/mannosyltransferase
MQAARIAVPTAATRDQAIELLQLPAAKFRVIPFGADHLPPDMAGAPRRESHALCLGTIEPRKNHVRLIAAWRLLPAPRPPLIVAGRRGWECIETVAALRQAEAEGLLQWIPDAGDERIAELLRDARLLVYPSQLEGFGFPPLEAMARGIPVVAGDTPALAEVLDDAAVLCDPRDVSAIAAGVARVWHDAQLRTRLRERGEARAARYRWDACAAAHAELYREVVA